MTEGQKIWGCQSEIFYLTVDRQPIFEMTYLQVRLIYVRLWNCKEAVKTFRKINVTDGRFCVLTIDIILVYTWNKNHNYSKNEDYQAKSTKEYQRGLTNFWPRHLKFHNQTVIKLLNNVNMAPPMKSCRIKDRSKVF